MHVADRPHSLSRTKDHAATPHPHSLRKANTCAAPDHAPAREEVRGQDGLDDFGDASASGLHHDVVDLVTRGLQCK